MTRYYCTFRHKGQTRTAIVLVADAPPGIGPMLNAANALYDALDNIGIHVKACKVMKVDHDFSGAL